MSAEIMAMIVALGALAVAATALVMSWMTRREKYRTAKELLK